MPAHPPRRAKLTVAQQHAGLLANPLTATGRGGVERNHLTWRYEAQPTPISRIYGVRVEYPAGDIPKVYVDYPDLDILAEGRKIPHLYGKARPMDPPRLCLYLPKNGEWWGWMRLDQTVVPWAATWLYYFEHWLATDDWQGGGEHPGDPAEEDRACREFLRRSEQTIALPFTQGRMGGRRH